VRVAGELTEDKIRICRQANAIVEEEVQKEGLDKTLWQYFAVLTNTKVTGVKGDIRDYGYLVVLRMVESLDAMTADVPDLPWNMVKTISRRITAEIPEVTHVSLSVSDKPPSTIELA
jgi:GMP synthase (glutamine-hydrolysing)